MKKKNILLLCGRCSNVSRYYSFLSLLFLNADHDLLRAHVDRKTLAQVISLCHPV